MGHVRKWVEGYLGSPPGVFNVPKGWKLVFTGHSMGGAIATLMATLAETEGWSKTPDAVITFGAPRVGDGNLSRWWDENDLCSKLLRINVYNDVVHWMPYRSTSEMMESIVDCAEDVVRCLSQPAEVFEESKQAHAGARGPTADMEDQWRHVCEASEHVVPGALKGINPEMKDFSPMGGVLSHFLGNGLFGY